MLLYHYSFNNYLFNKNYEYLHTLINLNYKSFLLLCEYISNKISSKESENIFVKKLRFMLTRNLKHITVDNKEFKLFFCNIDLNISNLNYNLIEIKYYLFLIQKNIGILLKNLINDQFKNDLYLIDRSISHLSGGEIINFFRKKIFHIINKNGSVCGNDASFYGGKDSIKDIKIPYLNYKSNKKYTLVLDLDETLISFKMLDSTKNQGILRLRPGLYEFLTNVKLNYELIIFTSATKEYADPLIDAIEKKEKYFDFRLYRHHTIICDNEFVKDIGRLGRPMNKLIIVDNLPQNFRLQKENGIMIKAFWGEDVYDTALYELSIVLNKIANNNFYDTRKGIITYKNDILSKVSSCFSRTNTFE
jgi:Dullard-like phosphatase family protein